MRILITTPPSLYASNLSREFVSLGHEVRQISYGRAEQLLPAWVRHAYFLLKIFPSVLWSKTIITLDTYSVGVPSVLAATMFGKKIIVRIGGDFLWESYVERTGNKITLREFNSNPPQLNLKEKLIFFFTKVLVYLSDKLVFNTEWQRDIWQTRYGILESKSCVVRNHVPAKNKSLSQNETFLWAGRKIKLKNIESLEELSKEFEIEMVSGLSHGKLQEKIKNCYAVILPSFSEVCPNFILEAASFGKPFIMTAETGLK
ncbi:MAG: hypothetical protein WAX80_02010, partial [Minisyncoccia bacterium]